MRPAGAAAGRAGHRAVVAVDDDRTGRRHRPARGRRGPPDHRGRLRRGRGALPAGSARTPRSMRLYRAAGRPITVSPLLAELVATALEAARRTDGDVDPTVGIGDARARLRPRPRADRRRRGARVRLVRCGWRSGRCRAGAGSSSTAASLRVPPGVSLDLGATAKAWAADRSAALDRRAARRRRTGQPRRRHRHGRRCAARRIGRSWSRTARTSPRRTSPCRPARRWPRRARSAARWRRGGQSMHHVLDPRTSLPAPTVWRTVSVAAPTCVEANTLTTASIVRGHAAVDWLARATGHRPGWSPRPATWSGSAAGPQERAA